MSTKKISRVVAIAASVALLSSITTAPSQAIPKNDTQTLVSTEWLAKNINDPKIVVLEVSAEEGLYERGHINGAVKVSWTKELVDPVNRNILSQSSFQKLARKAGLIMTQQLFSTAITTTGSQHGARGYLISTV